ncbi:FFAR3 protein, partial [Atlantisia rogersi]|nr:FFAR3 protein [Atlantisia rogersi]
MAEAAAGMTWPLPAALCPVANFCFYSSIYLSSLFLAALSVQRYLSVASPLRYKAQRRRLEPVMAASAAIWLLACAHCSIVFVAEYHGGRGEGVKMADGWVGGP